MNTKGIMLWYSSYFSFFNVTLIFNFPKEIGKNSILHLFFACLKNWLDKFELLTHSAVLFVNPSKI